MEKIEKSNKAKTIRFLIILLMIIPLVLIPLSLIININLIWVAIAIFFSSWGVNFATLNEQESLPTNKEEAEQLGPACWVFFIVGPMLGIIIIIGAFLDPQMKILLVLAIGFFIWGFGSFVFLKRNSALIIELINRSN